MSRKHSVCLIAAVVGATLALSGAHLPRVFGQAASGDGDGTGLVFYAPFDIGTAAVVAGGRAANLAARSPWTFAAGKRRRALFVVGDLWYASRGNFNAPAGTISLWVRASWPPQDRASHYLFCLYGAGGKHPTYISNRFSILARGEELTFDIYDADSAHHSVGGRVRFADGRWHMITATWRGINSRRAELALYADGELLTSKRAGPLSVGMVAPRFHIGSDCDASPDYAAAYMDDFYIYDRALEGVLVRQAFRAISESSVAPAARTVYEKASTGHHEPAWVLGTHRFRLYAEAPDFGDVEGPGGVHMEIPADFVLELAGMGVAAALDPGSIRVLPTAARGDAYGAAGDGLPWFLDDGLLTWRASPSRTGAGRGGVYVYFNTLAVDTSLPLCVRMSQPTPKLLHAGVESAADFAAGVLKRPWDFEDGTFAGIRAWGNTPESIKNRKVANGALSMDVKGDPWFIWGDMWGPESESFRLNVDRYRRLEMRLRQNTSAATWQIFGRLAGTSKIVHHDFPVSGTGWQTVRIDLATDAGWRGNLSAFRIDPTDGTKAYTHVEIDHVRILNVRRASRGPVEVAGLESDVPRRIRFEGLPRRTRAGETIPVKAVVHDAAGRPVANAAVCIELVRSRNGRLDRARNARGTLEVARSGRRGLSDRNGEVTVDYTPTSLAAEDADCIRARVEGWPVEAVADVSTVTGPAAKYVVTAVGGRYVASADRTRIRAQLADRFGNPVATGGRGLRWRVGEDGRIESAQSVTAADGSAKAVLLADVSKRSVYEVAVEDDRGLSGESGPIVFFNEELRMESVRLLSNGYFAVGDEPYVPLGGYYANLVLVPEGEDEFARMASFVDCTDAEIDRFMEHLHRQGATAIRFMLRAHRPSGMEPMDLCGRVNPELFARIQRYMEIASRYGLKFMLTLHEDYTKPAYFNRSHLEQFVLPFYSGADPDELSDAQRRFVVEGRLLTDIAEKYTDADVIACQDAYVRELVGLLRGNPNVFSYELENEMVDCPPEWVNHQVELLKSLDPRTLVCISHGGLRWADPLWWRKNSKIDFYNYHLYPHHGNTTPEIDYATAVDMLVRYSRMAGPSFLGESLGDQFVRLEPSGARRLIARDIIWLSLAGGDPGVFFWNHRMPEISEFRLARDAASNIDWTKFDRKKPEVGVDVAHPLDDDKFFRTDPGKKVYEDMGRICRHYASLGVDFDFTFEPDAYRLHAPSDSDSLPVPTNVPVRPSAGYEVRSLVDSRGSTVLAYASNCAGIEKWVDPDNAQWVQYLRKRARAEGRFMLDLAAERYTLTLYNLDTGEITTRTVGGSDTIDLGATDGDFAFILVARTQ